MVASKVDLQLLLKRVVELVMPNLRHYYRLPRKGRVVKSYASDGRYWADVQPLRNDESADPEEPLIPRVEIPILWGGPDRGVVCPPAVGTLCDITFYDGDPNYPRLSNFRWAGNKAPACELGGFIIQQKPGVYVKISVEGNIIEKTDADLVEEIGGDKDSAVGGAKTEMVSGNWSIEVGGSASVIATEAATVQAPQINLIGNVSSNGTGGGAGTEIKICDTTQTGSTTQTGDFTLTGNLQVNGNINATGTILDGGGNTNHHSHP